MNKKNVNKVIEKHRGSHGALLGILEDIQKSERYNYLSQDVLAYVADSTGVARSKIYGVATFYSFFNLIPQGEHCVSVCRGTACHTRGSKKMLDFLKKNYDFEGDDSNDAKLFLTTKDRKLTLRSVACFGQCALAPVVEIDGKIYGNMSVDMLKKELDRIIEGEK
ncbi:MAG: NAD(P)H-dependent oxidoreductase subunit E [Elusimicrobiota bacterium]